MKEKKRVLVAPLDWGIGHATRCIPIIDALIEKNFEVIIAADKKPLALLKIEFPRLKTITIKGYNVRYSKFLPLTISIFLQIPNLF